ncbi:hypothetical protein DES53_107264 [Roseimicrobium gellanilyticum]|uniref:Uncharacterized protein n=1 Tax=Roseimicrobium gellanilyticum TaxID=748857 RepID=A0A366HFU4_9BACT|nr:hypothetical protein DES53_107264 [Roseimicrobium gellanilyticum]
MDRYYVNDTAQNNGDHEVHKENCNWLRLAIRKTDLGYHTQCSSAVQAARQHHRQVNGCVYCSPQCHTS